MSKPIRLLDGERLIHHGTELKESDAAYLREYARRKSWSKSTAIRVLVERGLARNVLK